MERRTGATRNRQTTLLKVGATSTAFFLPIILAAAYLNMGQTCCSGNCPPPAPPDFTVSKNTAGEAGNGSSHSSHVSADGYKVVFYSTSTNLVPPTTLGGGDAYLHNVLTGETSLISYWQDGLSRAASITEDGRYVAYVDSEFLDPYISPWTLIVRDLETGTDELIGEFGSVLETSASDGATRIAFTTDEPLDPADTNDADDVYVKDRSAGTLTRESVIPNGGQYEGAVGGELSADGEWLMFSAVEQGEWVVILKHLAPPGDEIKFPGMYGRAGRSMDSTGQRVVYSKQYAPGLFLFDRTTGLHEEVSVDALGNAQDCPLGVISGNGQYVAFRCHEPMTSHGAFDQVYVRDLQAGTTKLASIDHTGVPGDLSSVPDGMAYNGSAVVMETSAHNLHSGVTGEQVVRVTIGYWNEGEVCASDDATCDGVDDDCDGQTDEDFLSQATSCGIGACAASGATTCSNGQVVDSCMPGTPGVTDALCDGIDEDCDGQVDEDYQFEGQPATCPSFVSPRRDGIVCTDRLWVRLAFPEPVDPATTSILAVLVEDLDAPTPIETDVSDLFTIASDGAQAYVDLTVLGRSFLSVNGVTATFERVAESDPACPLCDDLGLTQDELVLLARDVAREVADPWQNTRLAIESLVSRLGCVLPDGPVAAAKAAAADAGICLDCEDTYCPNVQYCGKGNSETNTNIFDLGIYHLPGDSCLNRVCFDHDNCYRKECVATFCPFTPQGSVGSCDETMFAACDDSACNNSWGSTAVCALAISLKAYPLPNILPPCFLAPCGPQEICCQSRPESNATSCKWGCPVRTHSDETGWSEPTQVCPRCFIDCAHALQCPAQRSVPSGLCGYPDVGPNPGTLCIGGNDCSGL